MSGPVDIFRDEILVVLWNLKGNFHWFLRGLATVLAGEDATELISGVGHSTPGYIHDWPPNFNKYLERCACLDEDFFITTTYPYLINIFTYTFGYI